MKWFAKPASHASNNLCRDSSPSVASSSTAKLPPAIVALTLAATNTKVQWTISPPMGHSRCLRPSSEHRRLRAWLLKNERSERIIPLPKYRVLYTLRNIRSHVGPSDMFPCQRSKTSIPFLSETQSVKTLLDEHRQSSKWVRTGLPPEG
jgi:hypothetical protein